MILNLRPTNDLQQQCTVQQQAYEKNENVMSHPHDFSKISVIRSLYFVRSPYKFQTSIAILQAIICFCLNTVRLNNFELYLMFSVACLGGKG